MNKFSLRKTKPSPARPTAGLRLPSGWTLFREALSDYAKDWPSYVLIIGIVAIPSDLIGLSQAMANDATITSYLFLAAIFMNVAFVWAITRREKFNEKPRLSTAYYDGSYALLRFLLTNGAVALMMIPAMLGAVLYTIGVLGGIYSNGSIVEEVLIGIASLILFAPSFYLFIRYGLSPIGAVRDDLRPMAALGRSGVLTRGYFWPVTLRFLLLGLFLIIISVPVTILSLVLAVLRVDSWPVVIFEIVTTLTALPLLDLYLLRLYRALERNAMTIAAKDESA